MRAMNFQSDMDDPVRRSEYIFRGTVKKLNAVTHNIDTPDSSTVVASVDEALQAQDLFVHSTGAEITVESKKPHSVKMGQQLIFFAKIE